MDITPRDGVKVRGDRELIVRTYPNRAKILAHGHVMVPQRGVATLPSSSSVTYSRPFKMTIYLPLDKDSPFPASPSFLVPSQDPNEQLSKVIKAIMKARRIVVVCGKFCSPIE